MNVIGYNTCNSVISPGAHLTEHDKGVVKISSDVISLLIDSANDLFLGFQAGTGVVKYCLYTLLKSQSNMNYNKCLTYLVSGSIHVGPQFDICRLPVHHTSAPNSTHSAPCLTYFGSRWGDTSRPPVWHISTHGSTHFAPTPEFSPWPKRQHNLNATGLSS